MAAHSSNKLPEIDSLRRIKISDFRKLFRKAKELLSIPEYREREELYIQTYFYFGADEDKSRAIRVTYYPLQLRAVLRWSYNDEVREQSIEFAEVESNLGLAPFLSFLCPYTGKICRKLYTDGRTWFSRISFKHTYSDRRICKENRRLHSAGAALRKYERITSHRYMKNYYRGDITRTHFTALRALKKANYISEWNQAQKMKREAMIAQTMESEKRYGD